MNFFKIGRGGKFVVECVSNYINSQKCLLCTWIQDFFCRNHKISKLEKKFRENAFNFLKGIFSKYRGRKICQWWLAVLIIIKWMKFESRIFARLFNVRLLLSPPMRYISYNRNQLKISLISPGKEKCQQLKNGIYFSYGAVSKSKLKSSSFVVIVSFFYNI